MDALWDKFMKFADDQRIDRLVACNDLKICTMQCLARQRKLLQLMEGGGAAGVNNNNNKDKHRLDSTDISIDKVTTAAMPAALDMAKCVPGLRMNRFFEWDNNAPSTAIVNPNANENGSVGNETEQEFPVDSASMTTTTKKKKKKKQHGVNTNRTGTAASTTVTIPTCAKEIHSLWSCRAIALACSSHVLRLRECFDQYPDKTNDILAVPYFGYQQGGIDDTKSIPCRALQRQVGTCVAQKAAELEQRVSKRKAKEQQQQQKEQE